MPIGSANQATPDPAGGRHAVAFSHIAASAPRGFVAAMPTFDAKPSWSRVDRRAAHPMQHDESAVRLEAGRDRPFHIAVVKDVDDPR